MRVPPFVNLGIQPLNGSRQEIHFVQLLLAQHRTVAMDAARACVAGGAKGNGKPVLRPLCHALAFACVVDMHAMGAADNAVELRHAV